MASFNPIVSGALAQAVDVEQIIDALSGTAGKGVPISLTAISDPANFALTVKNNDTTNSRALQVLKSDGTVLLQADANGVTIPSLHNASTIDNNLTISGRAAVGGALNSQVGLVVPASTMSGTSQFGISSQPIFTTAATVLGTAVDAIPFAAAGAYTLGELTDYLARAPQPGVGVTVIQANGLHVQNVGSAGVTGANGVLIDRQSGATGTNIGLLNLGTTQLGSGGANANVALQISGSGMLGSGTNTQGLAVAYTIPTTSTGLHDALYSAPATAASAFILGQLNGLRVANFNKGAGSTVTTFFGIDVDALSGATGGTTAELFLGTPSGNTTNVIITTTAGATLTTAGAWTNAPSWAELKSDIRDPDAADLGRWFDYLATDYRPVHYRYNQPHLYTQPQDYDHFGFLLDELPQDLREVVCSGPDGGISTKDTEGFLLAMVSQLCRRIKALEGD